MPPVAVTAFDQAATLAGEWHANADERRDPGWWQEWTKRVAGWCRQQSGWSFPLWALVAPRLQESGSQPAHMWEQQLVSDHARQVEALAVVLMVAEHLGFIRWVGRGQDVVVGAPDGLAAAVSEIEVGGNVDRMDWRPDGLMVEGLLPRDGRAVDIARVLQTALTAGGPGSPRLTPGQALLVASKWMSAYAVDNQGWVVRASARTPQTRCAWWAICPEWSTVEHALACEVDASRFGGKMTAAVRSVARWVSVAAVARALYHDPATVSTYQPHLDPNRDLYNVTNWVLAPFDDQPSLFLPSVRVALGEALRSDIDDLDLWEGRRRPPADGSTFLRMMDRLLSGHREQNVLPSPFVDAAARVAWG